MSDIDFLGNSMFSCHVLFDRNPKFADVITCSGSNYTKVPS